MSDAIGRVIWRKTFLINDLRIIMRCPSRIGIRCAQFDEQTDTDFRYTRACTLTPRIAMKTALTVICPMLLLGLASWTETHADEPLRQVSNTLLPTATRYEAAVDSFETAVKRVRGFDRADLSLINRLDIASGRLTQAAKKPRSINQLYYRLRDVLKLQAEVEQKILGEYTLNRDIYNCWRQMDLKLLTFVDEYIVEVENPTGNGTTQRLSNTNTRRNRYLEFDVLPSIILDPPAAFFSRTALILNR